MHSHSHEVRSELQQHEPVPAPPKVVDDSQPVRKQYICIVNLNVGLKSWLYHGCFG